MYVLIYLFYAVEVVYKILNSRTFSSVSVAKVTFFYRQPVLGLSFVCVVVEAMLSPPLFYFSFALLDSKFSPSAPFPLYCSISKGHLFLSLCLVFLPLKICHLESPF